MNKEEITNSQDYKATKVALEWWYSLPEEQRKATDIDAEPDIVDAYSDGVIYGWNNPNWISVEERLPEKDKDVLVWSSGSDEPMVGYYRHWNWQRKQHMFYVHNDGNMWGNITHWMEIQPPRKEEKQ